jgi:Phytanoyl-CoA dioxygenase (PhyH)
VARHDPASAVEGFTRDGYRIMPNLFGAEDVGRFRALREAAVRDWRFVHGSTERPLVVGDLLERYPRDMLPVVTHAALLRFAEAVMGPVVQLDSVVLFGANPRTPQWRGQPVCWHRDRFGSFPSGAYTRPLTLIYFIYLQDMTEEAGPLRVIPASHRDPIEIAPADVGRPHPDERRLHVEAGDVIVIHNNLLHSGGHNVTAAERQFLGISYTLSCLRVRDDTFGGPNCHALTETARRTHDRRLLRLLGHDDQITERQNTGFTTPPHADWAAWHHEDDDHAREASAERAEVTKVREMLS